MAVVSLFAWSMLVPWGLVLALSFPVRASSLDFLSCGFGLGSACSFGSSFAEFGTPEDALFCLVVAIVFDVVCLLSSPCPSCAFGPCSFLCGVLVKL